MTHLCVAIFVDDLATTQSQIALAAAAGADMVELRVDRMGLASARILADAALPGIVTCRPTWEGGQSNLSDADRMAVLDAAAEEAAYIDIELKADRAGLRLFQFPRDSRPGIIFSSHDFTGRPDRLYNTVEELEQSPCDVAKIVWTARTIRDNLEAFELLRNRSKPMIALCMGEAGLISRILAKKFGAFLTFAALESGSGTAPGQISIADMKKIYRWDKLGPDTRVYGVVGSPIMHSMSPAIHNAGFDTVGHDGIYLPLLVEPGYESFKAFMETFLNFDGLHLSGLSVTIPHKENCLRYLQEKGAEIEPLAQSIGTVNTVVIDRTTVGSAPRTVSPTADNDTVGSAPRTVSPATEKGPQCGPYKLRGFNTDYAAILDAITIKLGIRREDLAGYRVAVIGAGGTGRTAVAALAHYRATTVVYNRTLERAEELAAEFTGRTGKVVAAPLAKLCDSCCQIYINTTSVGMHPNVNESPVGDKLPKWSSDTLVFDTIYNPMRTRLLQQAEEAGARTISGVEMFVRQAVGQFEAWTGKPAPADVFRQVIESRLRGK
ncbi:MAG: type I 3-dehydroquinate dehydratase [Tepidisphaerales bacterium]